ncbi:hypothetical protein BJY24_000755 [Nocardia transvalensis]|uniref:Uncharacterized protein n=1 Tax=Nocardia transvalensis TaxID=37333 RepID=A0A7W9P9X8_9NOCA|nr:hypothetical protein [Nocardia transvalensis]MBB5911888.1 hypothetical protein [Nocardia transvalensis]
MAAIFVRNTVLRWRWDDVLIDGERAVREMTGAFVAAVEARDLGYPTRMGIRLRAVSSGRLVIEVHDSAENASVIADSGRLVTETVERISVRCGQYCTAGRTVLWAEIGRPEAASRWA